MKEYSSSWHHRSIEKISKKHKEKLGKVSVVRWQTGNEGKEALIHGRKQCSGWALVSAS